MSKLFRDCSRSDTRNHRKQFLRLELERFVNTRLPSFKLIMYYRQNMLTHLKFRRYHHHNRQFVIYIIVIIIISSSSSSSSCSSSSSSRVKLLLLLLLLVIIIIITITIELWFCFTGKTHWHAPVPASVRFDNVHPGHSKPVITRA